MGKRVIETVVEHDVAPSTDEIDLLLADLETDTVEEAPIETDVVDEALLETEIEAMLEEPVGDDDVTAAITELAIEESKAEAYAAEPGTELDIEATKTETVVKKARAKKEATPKAPRVKKTAAELSAESFVLSTEDDLSDLEALKTRVMAEVPKQKKIAEKFDNLLCSIAAGKLPSVYTVKAFQALDGKTEIASTELVATLQAAGYGIGTARSQAGQMMVLFDKLGIAKRSGNKLTPLATSTLAVALRDLIAKGEVAAA